MNPSLQYRALKVIFLSFFSVFSSGGYNSFQIQRQQASKEINKYNKDIAPGNLVHDAKLKGYRPSANFRHRTVIRLCLALTGTDRAADNCLCATISARDRDVSGAISQPDCRAGA